MHISCLPTLPSAPQPLANVCSPIQIIQAKSECRVSRQSSRACRLSLNSAELGGLVTSRKDKRRSHRFPRRVIPKETSLPRFFLLLMMEALKCRQKRSKHAPRHTGHQYRQRRSVVSCFRCDQGSRGRALWPRIMLSDTRCRMRTLMCRLPMIRGQTRVIACQLTARGCCSKSWRMSLSSTRRCRRAVRAHTRPCR